MFSQQKITYVTKFKKNAKHRPIAENEIPDDTDDTILIDEAVEFRFGEKKESQYSARRIACWDDRSGRVVEYLTNSFELSPNEIVEIYRRRWHQFLEHNMVVSGRGAHYDKFRRILIGCYQGMNLHSAPLFASFGISPRPFKNLLE